MGAAELDGVEPKDSDDVDDMVEEEEAVAAPVVLALGGAGVSDGEARLADAEMVADSESAM